MEDENNFWLGKYVQIAVASALSKDAEYPSKPMLQEYYEDLYLTEEQKDAKELQKMLLYEEQWRMNDLRNGLSEVTIK